MEYQEILRKAAGEGIVLLKNENQTLPFTEFDRVSIFGRAQIDYYKSGTGSGGSVHVPFSVNLLDGIEKLRGEGHKTASVNQELVQVYRQWIRENPFDTGNGEWASEPWCQVEMEISEKLASAAAKKSEKAVYLIGRTAGEDQDNRAEKGSWFLTDTERANLEVLCRHFEKVTVVLNVSNIIDTSWILEPRFSGKITGLLYSWQGGMQGGQGLADVLFGKISPSGKLADTIALKIEDYPSTAHFGSAGDEIYAEGIYVGYRHFCTFAKDRVLFPFGFGLSYTTFKIEQLSFNYDDYDFEARLIVTNTGNMPGMETVQIYCQAPQGKLGKPSRTLVAFKKTKLLAAGESQVVTMYFRIKNLASFDDSGVTGFPYSFVLEEGIYSFYAGSDCMNCIRLYPAKGYDLTVSKTCCTEKLSSCCSPSSALSKRELKKRIENQRQRHVKSIYKPVSVGFNQVVKNPALIDEFISGLTDAELMTLVRGEGMMSRKVTSGVSSAFGGISESLHAKKIPAVACCDGPSGIRFDNGKEACSVPIGTLLACTWNPELVEEVYRFVGEEMLSKNCDVLLGPGCNIHRNPLNGRNFEYFSEDPLVSGIMAVSVCKGLSKSGALGTIKHFALNNQESHRRTENSVVSERAMREIYLKPFEMAVKSGFAHAVMTSYNGINGHKAASNFDLNTTILRNQWGFKGMVMTDWWASMNDCVNGGQASGKNMSDMILARNDVYMVVVNDTADKGGFGDDLEEALKNGKITRTDLAVCAKDILLFIAKTHAAKMPLRPLKNEIVVRNCLEAVPENSTVLECEAFAEGSALGQPVYFNIPNDGMYEVFGSFCKDGGETLSQSITNVLINSETIGSFECRSTGGKNVYTVASQLHLSKGVSALTLEHTKPGITVTSITIRAEEDSPIATGEYE